MAAEEGKHERAREAQDFAERCFVRGDIAGAIRWCQTARTLAPDLPGVAQAAEAYNVHSVAARKPVGAGREAVWYAVLDLAPPRSGVVTTHDAIKKQYRKMCMLVHPDKNNSAAADGAFKLIQAAWTALSARHPPSGSTASPACPPRAEELHRHRPSPANKPRPDPPQTTPKQHPPPPRRTTPEPPSPPQTTPERPSPQKTPEQPSSSQTKYKRSSPQTKYKRWSPKPKPQPPAQPQPTVPKKPQVVQMRRTANPKQPQPDLGRMPPPPPMASCPSTARGQCPYCGAQYIGTQIINKAFRCMSCRRSPMDNKQWNYSDYDYDYYDDYQYDY
ncbi:hypothetical protein GUJ93_ZPchr0003g18351 [Zizania palustris]|uniref:J domain-containing protein n=1 Tax=Zizania palustris TaxID=103762 RepID=A0A8J5VDZ0_ZIZPA|nr:hypothetical protein GUJ93_ZPchr0003g18351 [Zizania palustris]